MSFITELRQNEALRQQLFPVTRNKIFLGHAGVAALPAPVAEAMKAYLDSVTVDQQEFGDYLDNLQQTRRLAADFIGAKPGEIALLGPTSLGLSLFANGLTWQAGDEVVCYQDDYPANVYPWLNLRRQGVVVRYLATPGGLGQITPEVVEAALTPRTKLVALASCHFLTGHRLDVDGVGQMLHARGILFSLDAIQTLGAFPCRVDHVDFLSADAHKWLLGPLAAGVVYVKEEHFEKLRPTLLGAWNVRSPNFITQSEIEFEPTARRYEPGVLNAPGIYGTRACFELLNRAGIGAIAARLLELRAYIVARLTPFGLDFIQPSEGVLPSGAVTCTSEKTPLAPIFEHLMAHGVICSLRHNRSGVFHLRFSPHFYNTEAEIDRVAELIENKLASNA